jgi:hypothetical protein
MMTHPWQVLGRYMNAETLAASAAGDGVTTDTARFGLGSGLQRRHTGHAVCVKRSCREEVKARLGVACRYPKPIKE